MKYIENTINIPTSVLIYSWNNIITINVEKTTVIPPTSGVGVVCIFLLHGISIRADGKSDLYKKRPIPILNSSDRRAIR